ncbi:MAG: PEP/pyruvate-binding domain-containing protein, partial [Phycisphaerae bacterium]|nr:PEP/pyruvate-binding domain-containing protein [Phycisphaerae bacterium]
VIKDVGRGAYYLFDNLSDLTADWYSDQMLGNFFMLTCPYLHDMETVAYFALTRNFHSSYAVSPITETTQVLLDILRHDGALYIQPMKVRHRYSPTMYMLHACRGDNFVPITQSTAISEVLRSVPWRGLESSNYRLGIWSRAFLQAKETLTAVRRGTATGEQADKYFHRLLRMAISRDERILRLAKKYFTLSDVLDISGRMIGTGLIGGKSVGMLLARAILRQTKPRWTELLERHDSFFIGSDVFYTFLVTNGMWWIRQQHRDLETLLESSATARHRALVGTFPEHIEKQFSDMLDYFGQSPIIVRSSSLLEDNFSNTFAGKYESVFCANQGPKWIRMEEFLSALRTVYASSMSEKALAYRAHRGMLGHDEQMAVLVQRVSGAVHDKLFYPQIAGVGLSFNPYVWNKDIDPTAGVLRMVFGLGTRAVDSNDDDYTRVVALNAPEKRPETNFNQVRQFTQKKVDLLDIQTNQLRTRDFQDVAQRSQDLPMDMFVSCDEQLAHQAALNGSEDLLPHILTFEKLLSETGFVKDMREMLNILQTAYDYPVDVEFTTNFIDENRYTINIVQCRPFQYKGAGDAPEHPGQIAAEDLVLQANGAVIGQSRIGRVDRFIYVVPATYSQLSVNDRYSVARLIGRIGQIDKASRIGTVMLLGPGRWGTTTPSLGVPISFSDISSVSILCEIVAMREGLVPDASLGTHLFGEMVEMDMLYLALFPNKEENFLNEDFFIRNPNQLGELLSEEDADKWGDVVRVVDTACLGEGLGVNLYANTLEQTVICYIDHADG